MKGFQIAWYVYKHYAFSETDGSIWTIDDLCAANLKGDNLEHFIVDWEKVILRINTLPDDNASLKRVNNSSKH
eukprot:9120982-Karenia_brevis.AAC.1